MKKLLIIVGLLLVAAVFMSGCVTETEDPIVGIWHNDKFVTSPSGSDFDSGYYVFNADGTGFNLVRFAGDVVYGKLDFTWKNEGDGKYTVTRADVKGTGFPESKGLVLDGDELSTPSIPGTPVFHKEPVAEYLVGLWVYDLPDYEEYQDYVCLVYFAEDGTGNVITYGPEVMGIDDIYTYTFTWEEKNGRISGVDEYDDPFTLTVKNGFIYNEANEEFHKYAVEDRLLGLWLSDEPSKEAEGTFDIVILLRPDGTGVEIWTLPGSHVAAAKYYFTWEMTGPITYQAVYDDGDVWDFAAADLGLTDGEVTYSKVGYDILSEYAQKVTA